MKNGNKAISACLLMIPALACAVEPMLQKGTRELGVGGHFSDTDGGYDMTLDVRGGYFVADAIEVGVEGGIAYVSTEAGGVDTTSMLLGVGCFGEYNLTLKDMPAVVPYIGAAAGVGYWSWETDAGMFDADDSEFVITASGWGGAKFYVVDSLAIGMQLQLDAASEDIYDDGDAFDWQFVLRTSFYF